MRSCRALFILPILALSACTQADPGSRGADNTAESTGDEAAGGITVFGVPIGAEPGVSSDAPIDPELLEDLVFDGKPYDVKQVIDGDTVHLNRDGRTEKVRLIGINTPEPGDGRRAAQCFGREASAYAKDLFRDHQVYLATDPSIEERDTYGRLLAYVWLDDGTFVNLEMLEEGYANEFTFDKPYRHRDLFRQASREAREGDAGLWAPDTCDGDFDARSG